MKRAFAAGLLAATTMGAAQGTASAHLHYITFDGTAAMDDGGAVVAGVIECHPGWGYSVTVKLENTQGHHPVARLGGRPICTGTPQPFSIRVAGDFSEGPTAVSVLAQGGTRADGVLHSLTSAGSVELVGS